MRTLVYLTGALVMALALLAAAIARQVIAGVESAIEAWR